jgi:CheY-like chemotaxis protein
VNALELPTPSCQTRRRLNNTRILIIDDDPALLESLAEMLTIRLGRVHVDTCSNPSFAGSMVRRGRYEVILCDISMPHINGLMILPILRHSAPNAAIVLMSAVADKGVQEKAFIDGATAFLAKPFDREVLTGTLKQLLKRSSHGGRPVVLT